MDDDPEVFVIALSYVAKARGVANVANVANVAEVTDLNRESLYKVFSGKVKPLWATIPRKETRHGGREC
jgi:probable addiction module antidote protein